MEEELLTTCGLSGTEKIVLLDLLEREATTAGSLSQRLKLKRATAYSALNTLESRGLIIRNRSGSVTRFSAVQPTLIPKMLCEAAKSEFEKVKRASELLETRMADYRAKIRQRVGGYEISTSESREAAFQLIYEVLISYDLDAIWDPASAATGVMETPILNFIKETSLTKPHIRDIMVDGPRGKWYLDHVRRQRPRNPNHQIRVLPKHHSILTDFVIANNSVYLTSYDPGAEMIIQIKHPAYYNSMRSIFEFVWNNLQPVYQ